MQQSQQAALLTYSLNPNLGNLQINTKRYQILQLIYSKELCNATPMEWTAFDTPDSQWKL